MDGGWRVFSLRILQSRVKQSEGLLPRFVRGIQGLLLSLITLTVYSHRRQREYKQRRVRVLTLLLD